MQLKKKSSKIFMVMALMVSALFGGVLPTASAADPISPLPHLAIYYGWPSLVNGAAGNLTTATSTFNQYDILVFADGLEHSGHGDHANTQTIMTNLKNNGKKVFGYIDLGVITQNLSVATMQTYVTEWKNMGAYGIFLDDYGFDYGVTRARQNMMLTYIHNAGLKVMMNSWNVDDAMGNNDENGNGSSTGTGSYTPTSSSYPAITINGSASEWSGISALATGSTTVTTLKVSNNASQLYLLIQGSGLNVKGQFYLNSDNNTSTGYNPTGWTSAGADYLVENNTLFSYTGNGTTWSWSQVAVLSASQYVKNNTVVEASIPLGTIGISAGSTIRVGYIKNDSATDRLPGSGGLPSKTLLP